MKSNGTALKLTGKEASTEGGQEPTETSEETLEDLNDTCTKSDDLFEMLAPHLMRILTDKNDFDTEE